MTFEIIFVRVGRPKQTGRDRIMAGAKASAIILSLQNLAADVVAVLRVTVNACSLLFYESIE